MSHNHGSRGGSILNAKPGSVLNANQQYQIMKPKEDDAESFDDIDLSEYLKDIFDSYYSEFLLNFEMGTLMEALAD